MKRAILIFATLLPAATLVSASLAQTAGEGPLKGTMVSRKVAYDEKEKKEIYLPADQGLPGDILEYLVTYVNRSKNPLKQVAIDCPLPEKTLYLADTARCTKDGTPLFSIDGGKTFQSPPIRYKFTLPDGKVEERVATPDMYTHMRWTLDFEPGETIEIRYRVKIL